MSRPINKSKGDHCTACDGTGLAQKPRQEKTSLKEDSKGNAQKAREKKMTLSKNRKGYK